MEPSSVEAEPEGAPENENGNRKPILKRLGWPKTNIILTLANGPVMGTNTAHAYVKVLYMTEELGMTKQRALLFVHGSQGLKVFGGILAGIVADSYTGKYLVLAISYTVQSSFVLLYGVSLLTVKWIYIVALLLENVAMFGQPLLMIFLPEQFNEADRDKKLQMFYTYDYIYLNFCAIFFSLILIEIANEYNCLSVSKCYSAIFFPYAAFVIIYTAIFVSMKKLYKMNLPTRPIIKDVIACIFAACFKKFNYSQTWADKRCDQEFKNDVIQLRRLALIMSLSFLFYLVYYQTDTTFIYQASFLDGSFGDKWIMKPSHVEIINPIGVITFAPLLHHLIFPKFDKWGILNTPLQKIGTSYLFASVSFLTAGVLQYFIKSSDLGITGEDDAQLRFYNAMPVILKISGKETGDLIIPGRSSAFKRVVFKEMVRRFEVEVSDDSGAIQWRGEVDAVKGASVAYIFHRKNLVRVSGEHVEGKSKSLRPRVVVYCGDITCTGTFAFKNVKTEAKSKLHSLPANSAISASVEISYVGWFELYINDTRCNKFQFKDGGMYALLLLNTESPNVTVVQFTLHSPNSIHILWIFPQIIAMSLAEIFQYIPSTLFVFTQSPPCMRSVARVIQSSFISLAHLLIASLNQIKMEDTVWFFSLSALVLVTALLHVILSIKYVYVVNREE